MSDLRIHSKKSIIADLDRLILMFSDSDAVLFSIRRYDFGFHLHLMANESTEYILRQKPTKTRNKTMYYSYHYNHINGWWGNYNRDMDRHMFNTILAAKVLFLMKIRNKLKPWYSYSYLVLYFSIFIDYFLCKVTLK